MDMFLYECTFSLSSHFQVILMKLGFTPNLGLVLLKKNFPLQIDYPFWPRNFLFIQSSGDLVFWNNS